jgi:predicted amidohydrolase YtcJ/heat shock protein HslJ
MKGAVTQMNDLQGHALLPGFIDAHSHYINALLVAGQCKLYAPPSGPGADVPSIIEALKKFALERGIGKGELIMGYGYDDTVMPDGRLLNRDDLDAAFPDNPVRIDHVSMHGCVLNSEGSKKYGLSASTPTPIGGVIVREPGSQEPWGLIMETAFLPIFVQTEPLTAQQEIDLSRAGQLLYAEAGITTAHEGATHIPQFETMKRVSEAGANIIDIVAFPFITELDHILSEMPASEWGHYHQRLKLGGVKITLDGSPQGRTALFRTPYLAGGPGGQKDWLGEPTFPPDLIKKAFKKVYDLDLPLNAHCNGDAAIDLFLEACAFARNGDQSKPWNVTTIHTQFLRKDQIPKFVEYQVRPSLYTLHTFYFAEAHILNRGMEQAQYISPMRDAIDAGLRPTNHTDFVVAPLDQLMMLRSAVERVSRGGSVIGADQRVTTYEGLKAMTIWVAEQYGEEATKGTLTAGKIADLVILDKDPLKVAPNTISDIKVLETIKDGTRIYPAEMQPVVAAVGDAGKRYSWTAHSCDMGGMNEAAHKEWRFGTLNGRKITTSKTPTLKFEHGQVTLFGGINRITGSYALVGTTVTLGDLAATKMAGPEALMTLEAELTRTLSAVDGFKVTGDRLTLTTQGHVVAELGSGR